MKPEELALSLIAEGCSRGEIYAATGLSRRAVLALRRQPAVDAAAQECEQISAAFRAWPALAAPTQVVSL
ncbi:hypothetical protein FHR55_000693 [Xanthomonas arboricola]